MTFAEQVYLWFGLGLGAALGLAAGYAFWGHRMTFEQARRFFCDRHPR